MRNIDTSLDRCLVDTPWQRWMKIRVISDAFHRITDSLRQYQGKAGPSECLAFQGRPRSLRRFIYPGIAGGSRELSPAT